MRDNAKTQMERIKTSIPLYLPCNLYWSDCFVFDREWWYGWTESSAQRRLQQSATGLSGTTNRSVVPAARVQTNDAHAATAASNAAAGSGLRLQRHELSLPAYSRFPTQWSQLPTRRPWPRRHGWSATHVAAAAAGPALGSRTNAERHPGYGGGQEDSIRRVCD